MSMISVAVDLPAAMLEKDGGNDFKVKLIAAMCENLQHTGGTPAASDFEVTLNPYRGSESAPGVEAIVNVDIEAGDLPVTAQFLQVRLEGISGQASDMVPPSGARTLMRVCYHSDTVDPFVVPLGD